MRENGFWMAVLIGLLLIARVSLAEDRVKMWLDGEALLVGDTEMDVTASAMGNSDVVLVRVGLSEPNNVASWGLAVAHRPKTFATDQSTAFGVWGALSTEVSLVEPGTLGMWAGLAAHPFADVDVMYDIDQSRIQVWPGAGVRLAPTKTLSFVARAVYPLGDDNLPSALNLNEVSGLFGLEINF